MWHPTTSLLNSFGNYFAPPQPQNLFYGYDLYGFSQYSYPCSYFDRSYLNALPQCSSGPYPSILEPAPQITSCNDSSVNNQPLSTGKELLFTPFSKSRMDDPELFLSTIKSHFAQLNLNNDEILELLPVTLESDVIDWFYRESHHWKNFEHFEHHFRVRFSKQKSEQIIPPENSYLEKNNYLGDNPNDPIRLSPSKSENAILSNPGELSPEKETAFKSDNLVLFEKPLFVPTLENSQSSQDDNSLPLSDQYGEFIHRNVNLVCVEKNNLLIPDKNLREENNLVNTEVLGE